MTATNITDELLSNADIGFAGATTASLPSGTTTYVGKISGSGTLALTSASNGGSTLIIGAQTFILPDASQTVILSLANGAWTADVTSSVLNQQAVVLTGASTLELPAGNFGDHAPIGGNGRSSSVPGLSAAQPSFSPPGLPSRYQIPTRPRSPRWQTVVGRSTSPPPCWQVKTSIF